MKTISSHAITKSDIKTRECKFVLPLSLRDNDIHLIKEHTTLSNGEHIKRIILVEDYERPIWITKKSKRHHKDKRERESFANVDEYKVTRLNEVDVLRKALGLTKVKDSRMLYESPYVYGTDIPATVHIKNLYDKNPNNTTTPYEVAVLDIETDEHNKTIMITLSFKDRVYTGIVISYLGGHYGHDVTDRLQHKFHDYLDEYIKNRNIQWEIGYYDTAGQAISGTLKKAHEWSPDILAIWNINFDIPIIIDDLNRENMDPGQVFSDPAVPTLYRYFKYNQGNDHRKKASGDIIRLSPSEQWHTVDTPASFYIVDAMQVYAKLRTKKKPSYSLDSILNDELGIRKLKFKEADHLTGMSWHKYMREQFPLEYIIYNVFDCISIEILNEKVKDLSLNYPYLMDKSELSILDRSSRRSWEDISMYLLDEGYAPGNGKGVKSELDGLCIGTTDWIVALPSPLLKPKEADYVEEGLSSKIYAHCSDIDIASAYPSNTEAANVSKETTVKELVSIDGIPEYIRRRTGLNLSGGISNAADISSLLFGLPSFTQLNDIYRRTLSRDKAGILFSSKP